METLQSGSAGPADDRRVSAAALALVLTIVLRALYTAVAALLAPKLSILGAMVHANKFTEHLMSPARGYAYALLGVWERFDTLNYLHIAQNGYDDFSMVVFFPLYPLLIRLFTPVVRSPMVAAVAISTVATFFLFWGLINLLRLDFSERIAFRAVVFYAVWPAAFTFFCGYADSLVLALVVWSIYFARSGKWWLAGLIGMMAPLAKAVGVLVVLPLAVLALRERRWRNLWAVLPLVGAVIYPWWLRSSGLLMPWEAYPLYWSTKAAPPWTTVYHLGQSANRILYLGDTTNPLGVMLKMGLALFYLIQLGWMFIVVVLALSKKLRLEYLAYGLGAIYLILNKDSSVAQQQWLRHVLILFPAALVFSLRLQDRLIFSGVTAMGLGFNLLLMWYFLQWVLVV